MKNSKWIGTALGLALCTAFSACSRVRIPPTSRQTQPLRSNPPRYTWNRKLEQQARAAIANAAANGLKPDLFLKGDGQGAALTEAALGYAQALAHGYSDPTKLYPVYTIPRPSADVREGFEQAAQKGDLTSWFNSLPPQTDEYKALSQAHLKYLKLASGTSFEAVGDGKPINPGSHDARVPVLAAALSQMGYLTAPPLQAGQQPASTRYTTSLIAAVKRLQADFGLKVDGIVGGNTLAAVNLGPAGLGRMTAIAMERLRWLRARSAQNSDRREISPRHSWITGATDSIWTAARSSLVSPTSRRRKSRRQSSISSLIPSGRAHSIGSDELSTKSQAWLQENQFAMENGKFVQESGPKNSLGIVKFDMDDKQSIYLHDTPAKALFGLPDRHRSHGCVRVQDAVAFANAIATEEGVNDKFQEAMASEQEKWVKLPKPITVRLIYQTAFWDGSGVRFRPDVYGWDNAVAAALGLIRGITWMPVQQSGDVGP